MGEEKTYLDRITIDASIRNEGQLYDKYNEEAKEQNLNNWSEWLALKNMLMGSCFSLMISFAGNYKDMVFLQHVDKKMCQVDEVIRLKKESFDKLLKLHEPFFLQAHVNKEQMNIEQPQTTTYDNRGGLPIPNFSKTGSTSIKVLGDSEKLVDFMKLLEEYCTLIVNKLFSDESVNTNTPNEIDEIDNKPNVTIDSTPNETFDDLYFGFFATDPNPNNTKEQLVLFSCFSDKLENIAKHEGSKFVFKDGIIPAIQKLSSLIGNKHVNNLSFLVSRESVKSAIAAIMSRNMSHNLGSHFISNTKNYFGALVESDPNPENKKNYRGIKHALQYIQERMDFIATITSTDAYPFGAVNAKAQIFDELTPDDFGYRHNQESYNFLMDYLVLSEKISKNSRRGGGTVLGVGEHKMLLRIGLVNEKGEPAYWDSTDREDKNRDEILGINFAIPGGFLGRHAVFSIVENIIRNAAKHGQDKIKGDFVISMLYQTDRQCLVVFDNKNDEEIKGTIKTMEGKLSNLRFLTSEGALDHESKGLKEMLICAIWLQNENIVNVMAESDSLIPEERLKLFKKYLKVVAVDEDSNVFELDKIGDENEPMYLGYSFKLDQYEKVHYLKENELKPEGLRSVKADIVCYKEDCRIGEKILSEIFPRFLVLSSEDEMKKIGTVEILRQVVEKNCGSEVLQKTMVVDYTTDYKDNLNVIPFNKWESKGDAFLFKGHAGKSKWDKFKTLFLTKGFENKYVDAISGGDFTYTLVQPSHTKDDYNLLKIKESVATRFVIIDERVFEHYKSTVKITSKEGKTIFEGSKGKSKVGEFVFKIKRVLGNGIYSSHEKELDEFCNDTTALSVFLEKDIEQHYLERRGVFLFNLEAQDDGFNAVDLSSNTIKFQWKRTKDEFEKTEEFVSTAAATTFLSVHLGLIDKIREQLLRNEGNKGKGDAIDKEIVEALKNFFGAKFISVHSGRGGLDIRESLKQYTFQSFSAIENPFYNSKFLLAQQFYNLKYYGSKD